MAQTHPYSRGILDVASVFIAASWIGLWFLWPSPNSWTTRTKAMPAPRVSFYPHLASRDFTTYLTFVGRGQGDVRDDGAGALLGSLLRQPERGPRYLQRTAGADGLLNGAVAGPAAPVVDLGIYRPIWKDERVFSVNAAPPEMKLLSETSGELKKQNFEVPSFTDEEMKQFDKPWQVVVYVEVNESGRPAHVILQTGCEDPKINAAVVKALYRGKIPAPGAPCSGRVVLNYGRP
jgi:hypothetical protein